MLERENYPYLRLRILPCLAAMVAALGASAHTASAGKADKQGAKVESDPSRKSYLLVCPPGTRDIKLPSNTVDWKVRRKFMQDHSRKLIKVVSRGEVDPKLFWDTLGLRLHVSTGRCLATLKQLPGQSADRISLAYLFRQLLNARQSETHVEPDRIPVRGSAGKKLGTSGMVLVKGGKYVRGGKYYTYHVQAPMTGQKYTVEISSFHVDKHEVTVEDYCKFLNDGNEGYWTPWWGRIKRTGDGRFVASDPKLARMPVGGVNYYQATGYAEWAGKRLPTEAEWEYATGGRQGRKYPWGNEDPDETRANYDGKFKGAIPVGSLPKGRTPEGLFDLAGNVGEWCADYYAEDYYRKAPPGNVIKDPQGPTRGPLRMYRGGCGVGKARDLLVTMRHSRPPLLSADSCLGFRCVKSAEMLREMLEKSYSPETWQANYVGLELDGAIIPQQGTRNPTLLKTQQTEVERYGRRVRVGQWSFVRGKISKFGGPDDKHVREKEKGALVADEKPLKTLREFNKPLNADRATISKRPRDFYYIAMRWNYNPKPKTWWAQQRMVVINPTTGAAVVVRPIDWGPKIATKRTMDLSPQTLKDLGLATDKDALVAFVKPAAPLGPSQNLKLK